MKRQIGSLQRQAGKARRYQALLGDLQILDTHHSRTQLDFLEGELERSRTATGRFDEEQRRNEREIEERENEVAAQRGLLEEVDGQMNAARSAVQGLQNQIASHRNRIEFNRERAEELTTLIGRYEGDIQTAEDKLAQQETEIHDTDLLLTETERLLAAKQTELGELTTRAAEGRREREENEQELQAIELAISKAENRLADLETEISETSARRAATQPRLAELATSLGEAGGARDRIAAQLSALRLTGDQQHETLQSLASQIPKGEEEVSRQQQRLREAETAFRTSDRAIAERQSRLEILQQLNAEGEGLTEGSQAVLRGLDNPDRILPALTGALASLIEVDEEFIAALEAALGRNLHAIVLSDGALSREIIATLTESKLGQTALLIPNLGPKHAEDRNDLPAGALAWATDKVRAPAELEPVVRRLLGKVALVSDLEQAQKLKQDFPALAFATLGGELISTAGVIYGGRVNEEGHSLFARKAQIASLTLEHKALLDEQQILRKKREEIQDQLETAVAQLEHFRTEHQAARDVHSATALQITAIDRDLHEACRKADALDWERATLDQQMASSAERIANLESEAAQQRAFLEEERERHNTVQAAAENARRRDERTGGRTQ